MVKSWVVTCKDRTYKKRMKTLVKANTKEKAREYAIKQFQNNGYSNFQIISCEELKSYSQLYGNS